MESLLMSSLCWVQSIFWNLKLASRPPHSIWKAMSRMLINWSDSLDVRTGLILLTNTGKTVKQQSCLSLRFLTSGLLIRAPRKILHSSSNTVMPDDTSSIRCSVVHSQTHAKNSLNWGCWAAHCETNFSGQVQNTSSITGGKALVRKSSSFSSESF